MPVIYPERKVESGRNALSNWRLQMPKLVGYFFEVCTGGLQKTEMLASNIAQEVR